MVGYDFPNAYYNINVKFGVILFQDKLNLYPYYSNQIEVFQSKRNLSSNPSLQLK